MKMILALFLCLNASWAACTKIAMPTDFASVTSGTRANLKANFTEIQTRSNGCMDSVDEVRGRLTGYAGDLRITSLDNLRLRLDGDGSGTSKFLVETSNGDSLFRVSEDSAAKIFGTLAITGRTTLTDSLIGASQRLSGNLAAVNGTYSGNLAAVNGTYSGTLGVTGTLTGAAANFSGAASTGALSSTTGAFSGPVTAASTLGVVQALTVGDASTSNGIVNTVRSMYFNLDSDNDGSGESFWWGHNSGLTSSTKLMQLSDAGLLALTGSMTISSALGVTGVVTLGNYVSTRMPYFGAAGVVSTTSDLTWTPGTTTFATANGTYSGTLGVTGVATFTAAPVFSSVTASQILSVNGSKALTSVATTGSGSVALATSPTLVTPVLGAATGTSLNLSGNLTADSLVSSKFYTEGSFTATLTGVSGSTTGTAYYVRIGKQVTLVLPTLLGTSNTTACTITGLPAALNPARNQWFQASIQDNSSIITTDLNGTGIIIQTSGVIQLYFNGSTTFTSSGSKGINSGLVHGPFTYTLL
jgi:hypothetical protein